MDDIESAFAKFFGVITRAQTYLNLAYLIMAFPLGLFYFIFLVTGLSLGFPLIIIWVGLLILMLVFAAWFAFILFERQMAITLLHEDIPPVSYQDLSGKSVWQKFTATISNPVTWKGLAYLFAKFPLGIFSFVALVTLVSLSAALVGAPFYYLYVHPNIGLNLNGAYYNPVWLVDSMPKAVMVCLAGILVSFASLHVFNGLAWVSGKFARIMLGNFSTTSTGAPTRTVPANPTAHELTEPDPAI